MSPRPNPATDTRAAPARRGDLVLSLALPAAVIALGVALSVGPDGLAAVIEICRAALS